MRGSGHRVAVAVLIATFLGSAIDRPWTLPDFVSSAQAQTAARGLETRHILEPLDLPFDGEASSSELEIVPAFPNLSFSRPLYIAAAPGTDSHLYVVQQAGQIRRFANSSSTGSSSVFLDISARTRFAENGEDGLLGLAFHPNYAENGLFYLYYSPKSDPPRTVLSSFRRSASNPSVADPASEQTLLTVPQFGFTHRGGSLQFGPDGKLYLATGDGGGSTSGPARAQDLGSLSGKVIRLNADGSTPSDNPHVGVSGARSEIWARGLRNPWRFSFDRSTGRLWLADVGQDREEEVNLIRKGGNYGWGFYEGNQVFKNPDNLPVSNFDFPAYTYPHTSSDPDAVAGESITGGYVYRGNRLPQLAGKYLFADFIAGRLWALDQNNGSVTGVQRLPDVSLPASFGEDNAGNLYVVSLIPGEIYTLRTAGGGGSQIPAKLSDTGLFTSTASLTPNPGLIEYGINAPFWSDGTRKRRWIALANGSRIGFSSTAAWSWPARVVVVKHFEITLSTGVERRLETRVFVNTVDGWRGYTYRWNSAQTDADLLPDARSSVQLQVLDESSPTGSSTQTYVFPSRSDCLQCHTAAAGTILGPRTAQMNRNFTYPNGVTDNQLRAFNHVDLFTTDIGSATQYAALTNPANTSASLASRARAYLDTNCSQCHRPGGPTPVNLDLRATTSNAATNAIDQHPSGNDLDIDDALIIAAGDKERSVLWQRMRSLNDEVRMPPLGSHRVDAGGVELIGEWIDSLAVIVPTVSFTSASRTVSENAGTLSLTVQLSAAASATVTIPITVQGSASIDADYRVSTADITIVAGATSASRTITLIDDTLDEPTETLTIRMGTPTQATLGAITEHTISIEDQDAPPTAQFSTASSSANESAGTVSLRVDLSAVSGREVTVPVTFSGSARAPQDYAVPVSSLRVPAGASGAVLNIDLADDPLDEPQETLEITLGAPTNASLGARVRHGMGIEDNDAPPTVQFSTTSSSAGESSGTVRLKVDLSALSGRDVTVPIALSGTARTSQDYAPPISSLRIPAGASSGFLDIAVIDDRLDEPGETVELTLGAPTNATLGAKVRHVLRIEDNDAPPELGFATADGRFAESVGSVPVRVTLSSASGHDLTIPLSFSGTAQRAADYEPSATLLTIPAGALGASFEVRLIDDALDEATETVLIGMQLSGFATPGSRTQLALRIEDDDAPPRVSFATSRRTLIESAGPAIVRVALSAASGQEIQLPLVFGGSAEQGMDYTVLAPGLRIPAGSLGGEWVLSLVGDALNEGLETITVGFGPPTNAVIGEIPLFTLRITDDDPLPSVSFASARRTVQESGGLQRIRVQLSAPSGRDIEVPIRIGGSASRDADYRVDSPTVLRVPAGRLVADLRLSLVDDGETEALETIVLTLGRPTHAAPGGITEHRLRIRAND